MKSTINDLDNKGLSIRLVFYMYTNRMVVLNN